MKRVLLIVLAALALAPAASATQYDALVRGISGAVCTTAQGCQLVVRDPRYVTPTVLGIGVLRSCIQGTSYYSQPLHRYAYCNSNPYSYNSYTARPGGLNITVWARQPCVGGGGWYFSGQIATAILTPSDLWHVNMGTLQVRAGCRTSAVVA